MYRDNKFTNTVVKLIVLLLITIFGYLFIVSLFSTVYVSETENIYYIKDNIILNLLILIVSITAIYIFREKINSLISKNESKMVIFNSVLLSIILIVFIISTRFYPLYDQAKVVNTIKRLFLFDYSDFMPGGYIDKYDIQEGITLYFYILSKIFGRIDITKFQIINGIYIVLANFYIYKIFARLFSKKKAAFVHLAMCLYIPQWFYSSFIYGIIPSYFFGVLAVYYFIEIIYSEDKRRNYIYVVLTGLFLSISISLKTNSVIILVALVLLCIYFILIADKKNKFILTIVSLIVFYILSGKMVNKYFYSMTGIEMQGIPRTGHIAMALQDNSEKGPGWHNGYGEELYEKNGFNKEATNKEAVESIKDSLNGFKSNPGSFISFISRKIVSQWNDPTYESLFIMYGRDSLGVMPTVIKKLTTPTDTLNKAVREIMNIIQLFVFFGVTVFFILRFKTITMKELVPSIIVLGGFFFHILWEAKSQYIFVYILFVIPYAVVGIEELIRHIKTVRSEILNNKEISIIKNPIFKKTTISFIIVFAFIMGLVIIPSESVFGKIFKPSWKTEQYLEITNSELNHYEPKGTLDEAHIESLKVPKIKKKPGRYLIVEFEDENLVLCPDSNDVNETGISFNEIDKSNLFSQTVILFGTNDNEYSVRFNSTQRVLDVSNGEVKENNTLQQWDYNGDKGQLFILEEIAEGKSIIRCGNLVLGKDDGNNLILVDETDTDRIVAVRIKQY